MPLCNATDMPTSVMVLFYEKFTVRLSMRKTQMNLQKSGCASETIWTTWDSINWDKVARAVKSLQARIVKRPSKSDDRITIVVFRVLEPYEGKLSCTVLRGERESNLPDLLDHTVLVLRGSSNSATALFTRSTLSFFANR